MKALELTDYVIFFAAFGSIVLIIYGAVFFTHDLAKHKYYEQGFNDGHKSAINKVWESQQAESPRYIIIKENGFECIPPCEFPRDSLFFQLSSEKK